MKYRSVLKSFTELPLRRILLADDSAQVREVMGELLRKAKYDVLTASHGGQVLELLNRERVDLLLLDLNMPEFDGWETLDRLSESKPGLPVIVITGQPNQREWVESAGARGLLEKPFNLPKFFGTLEAVLGMGSDAEHGAESSDFRFARRSESDTDFTSRYRGWGINE